MGRVGRNWGFQFTLFQPGGIMPTAFTACPPGFDNLLTSMIFRPNAYNSMSLYVEFAVDVLSLQRLMSETIKMALFYSIFLWILSSKQIDI